MRLPSGRACSSKFFSDSRWTSRFLSVFADEGLSGMKAENRVEFQRMIEMCEHKQIDLIITKSVSRFARNVKEALEYVRKLKLLGIGVQFEKEGIYTLALGDEMLLNTFSAIAQEESKAISQNQRLSIVKRMERGEYVDSNAPYGFRLQGKKLEAFDREADVVRYIFQQYLSGWSTSEIARDLTEKGIQTKLGKEQWRSTKISYILSNERYVGDCRYQKTYRDTTVPFKQSKNCGQEDMVMNILKNEKYCGDCILQKTVTIDCISKTRKKNEGEAPMYIVENSHPAIISREMFNRAQEELSKRKARSPQSQKTAITASGKYSKYALTDVLICAECGSRYKRVTWTSLGQKRIVWRCVNRLDNGKKYCQHSPTLSEPALQEAIVRALNKFNDEDTSTYLTLMKATIGEAIGANGGSDEIDLLERRIDALNSRMLKMVSDSVERGADMEENEDEFKTISEQIEQLNRRIEAIRKSEGSDEDRQERLSLIQATIDQREANRDTYDDAIVRQMIECVKVHEGGKLTIIFGGGYEIEEQI